MSFKREGDDRSQLNILKKRRVADLLSNFIPEEEAALTKNGRYACLVCPHRPVFDTVDVLSVHRNGKRHVEGMKWFYGRKTQLQHEIDKRRHQEYAEAEDERQDTASTAPLLTTTRKITHHALLRSAPYSSCLKQSSPRCGAVSAALCHPAAGVGDRPLPPRPPAPPGPKPCSESLSPTPTPTPPAPSTTGAVCERRKGKAQRKRKRAPPAGTPQVEPQSEQRRRELDHYLRLKSSGWLQDRSGRWVKDQNVEFDSDEEPAPLSPYSMTSTPEGGAV